MSLDSGRIDALWYLVKELKSQNERMRNILNVLGVLIPNEKLREAISGVLSACDTSIIEKLENEADNS